MYKLYTFLKKCNTIFLKFLWFPIDFFVWWWLFFYSKIKKYVPLSYTEYTSFLITYVPSINFFYKILCKNKFFFWWWNRSIFMRLFYLCILFCIVLGIYYSFLEIHLISLIELLAVFELTSIENILKADYLYSEENIFLGKIFISFFQTPEECAFLIHVFWTGVFLILYCVQIVFFACLIFYFIVVVCYFWILFTLLNYFVFLDMFLPNAYDPTHIAILHAWHLLSSICLILILIVICRFFFIKFKFNYPLFNSNYWVYFLLKLKNKCLYYSNFFWKQSFFKKIWFLCIWTFFLNFWFLFIIILLQLLIVPGATGEFFWLLIVNVFSTTVTWNDFFFFPWTRLFQIFISISINVLYDFVYFMIILSSFYLLILIYFIQLLSLLLLLFFFPQKRNISKNYNENFWNILSLTSLFKKWMPSIREYCYAAFVINLQKNIFFVQGVKNRMAQRAYWKTYYQKKTKRHKTSLYFIFFNYFINNSSKNAGYKNTFWNAVTRDEAIWKSSLVYGSYLRVTSLTKGYKGRKWFYKLTYINFLKRRFLFYYLKWKNNPGILGHLLFNTTCSSLYEKIKVYFFIWNYFFNGSVFGGFLKLIVSGIVLLFSLSLLYFKILFFIIIFYTMIWHIIFYFWPKNNILKYCFTFNFIILMSFQLIFFYFLLSFDFFFTKFPLLKQKFLSNTNLFSFFYEQGKSFLYENKFLLLTEGVLFKIWFFFILTLYGLFFCVIGFLLFFLENVGNSLKRLWNFFNVIFSQSFLILIFFPFIIIFDFFLIIISIVLYFIAILLSFLMPFFFLSLWLLGFPLDLKKNYLLESKQYIFKALKKQEYCFIFLIIICLICIVMYYYIYFLCG